MRGAYYCPYFLCRDFPLPGQSKKAGRKRRSREGHAKLRHKGGTITEESQTSQPKDQSVENRQQFPSTRGLVSRPVRFA